MPCEQIVWLRVLMYKTCWEITQFILTWVKCPLVKCFLIFVAIDSALVIRSVLFVLFSIRKNQQFTEFTYKKSNVKTGATKLEL